MTEPAAAAPTPDEAATRARPTYLLATGLFLRGLGATYLLAFVSLWTQIHGLIGSRGILPVERYLARAAEVLEGAERFTRVPTLLWLDASDPALHALCALGAVAALLVVAGRVQALALAVCWVAYLSLTTAGQVFLGFQWDGLLLETGLLAIFLRPPRWRARPEAPALLPLWLLRWLLLRLMIASGAVKLSSGDTAWRALEAMRVHYETQPLPTWVGYFVHQLPASFQTFSTIAMFAIELGVPLLILAPAAKLRRIAAAVLIAFQALIAITGNYGFFNLLTALLCLLLLDDAILRARVAGPRPAPSRLGLWRFAALPVALVVLAISPLIFAGSLGLSPTWPDSVRTLHRAVAPLRSLNGYGLFAVMTVERPEIVVEGSLDGRDWRPYVFRWKPGDPQRRPRFVAPHMPRLDWQMWFAALGDVRRSPWFVAFLARLAEGSPPVLALLEGDPFDGRPPRQLRARLYDYRFTDLAAWRADGTWWRRTETGFYLPPVEAARLIAAVR